MRTITDHIVSGDQAVQLEIYALDEPGAGGANHEYSIRAFFYPGGPTVPMNRLNGAEVLPDGSVVGELGRISFQNGPIKEAGVNGLTQEALLAIVIDRLRSFQAGPYPSDNNYTALHYAQKSLQALQKRTLERIARGVEGTHTA